jgi:hypothetical protein
MSQKAKANLLKQLKLKFKLVYPECTEFINST